jgi:hypothetical protein
MTFKELQDLTLDNLQELQSIVDVSLTKIKKYINRGYFDFVKKTSCLQSEFTLTGGTVANQESYALDDYFYHVEHVRFIEDSTTEYGRILKPFPGGYTHLPKQKQFGVPYYYWVRAVHTRTNAEIGFYPIPGESGNTIKGWVYQFPESDLSANGDIPLIKEAWQDAIYVHALWKLHAAYAHKSNAIRTKANDFKVSYIEMVNDATRNFSELHSDNVVTVDAYMGYDGYDY